MRIRCLWHRCLCASISAANQLPCGVPVSDRGDMADATLKEKLLQESARAKAWLKLGDDKEYARCHKTIDDMLDILTLDKADAADRVTEHA